METTTIKQKTTHPIMIPVAIIIAGALIGVGIYFSRTNTNSEKKITQPKVTVTDTDHLLGSRDADIIIVEYSDLECPFCKRFNDTTTQIMDAYGASGKVALVFSHFPLDGLHQKSRNEAAATECVAELGGNDAFWKYLNGVFTITNSNDSLDPTQLPIIASQIGIDVQAFNSCMTSGRHMNTVQADEDSGKALGIQGTPYSIFLLKDGSYYTVNGAYPYELLDLTIQATLNGAPATVPQRLLDLVAARGTNDQINAYITENLAKYLSTTDTADTTTAQ